MATYVVLRDLSPTTSGLFERPVGFRDVGAQAPE